MEVVPEPGQVLGARDIAAGVVDREGRTPADAPLDHYGEAAIAKRGVGRIFARPGSGAYLLEGISEVARGFQKTESARPVIIAIGVVSNFTAAYATSVFGISAGAMKLGLFAVVLGGESVTLRLALGGTLVLAAMYLVELGPRRGADTAVPHLSAP